MLDPVARTPIVVNLEVRKIPLGPNSAPNQQYEFGQVISLFPLLDRGNKLDSMATSLVPAFVSGNPHSGRKLDWLVRSYENSTVLAFLCRLTAWLCGNAEG